jgi:PAS domain S-box-containing protein
VVRRVNDSRSDRRPPDPVFGRLFSYQCLYRAVVCGIILCWLSALVAMGVTRPNAWYIFAILVIEIALSGAYSILRPRLPGTDRSWYHVTLLGDIAAVTACIHFLGDQYTPYGLPVYAFLVVYTAAGVSVRECVLVSVASAGGYIALHAMRVTGVLDTPTSAFAPPVPEQAFLVNIFFLVLFLTAMAITAGHLASRIREEQDASRLSQEKLARLNAELEERVEARTAALTESEGRFRQLAENVQDAFWLVTSDLRELVYLSPAYERLSGRTRRALYDDVRGALQDIHPDDQQRVVDRFSLLWQGGTFDEEYRIVRPDGSVCWVRNRGFPIRDATGLIYRLAGVVEDVGERKQAEQRAQQHQAELAHVLRVSTMGEMAAGLAHELHQPIAAVVSAARACVRRLRSGTVAPGQLEEMMEEAATQGLRAGQIIQHLRAFLEKRERRRELVDLNGIVRDVATLVDAEARHGGVAVRLGLAPRLPRVHADRVQLEQVLVNVVRNGLEATRDARRRHAELWIETCRAEGDSVQVTVRDAGTGLTASVAERMFEPFFTTKSDGIGMGLAISRSIVEAHGGHIAATSNESAGATVRLALPVSGSEVRDAI